jgi:hypothetical protein
MKQRLRSKPFLERLRLKERLSMMRLQLREKDF